VHDVVFLQQIQKFYRIFEPYEYEQHSLLRNSFWDRLNCFIVQRVVITIFLIFLTFSTVAAPQNNGIVVRQLEFQGNRFTVVSADLRVAQLKMFWKDPTGQPFSSLENLQRHLTKNKIRLLAATNAGIFDTSQAPLGLHVQRGKVLHPLKTRRSGYGNFYLQPNGVFFLDKSGARILETLEFARLSPTALEATQSGPMLVQNGKIHSAFQKNSLNRLPRNMIGVENQQKVHLVISDDWVNFYDTALFMRDILKCQNALYLDGSISAMRIPDSREDDDGEFGGMIGIINP
jgi:uncharacterized protein YigE (DUF2233 family)